MKMSFCGDKFFLQQAKRDHAKDYPHQQHWQWRGGFVLVCFQSRPAYNKAVDQFGGLLPFKAMIQRTLGQAIEALC